MPPMILLYSKEFIRPSSLASFQTIAGVPRIRPFLVPAEPMKTPGN